MEEKKFKLLMEEFKLEKLRYQNYVNLAAQAHKNMFDILSEMAGKEDANG